ncbi:MAG: DNA repair protein RecO [Xenococcaceae cyanobacterium MO_207.B15]|nr:DNA repair protein RecO [Xenococcaceae cyanobacterium MO_207.B15]
MKYKATGIVLKGSPLKESDRLLAVLTPEYGLIWAVAPGAKKHKSRLRGRTELFVVNEFLLAKGRSLDKIIQADTIYTYPGLSQDVGKLASAQYLAELSLYLAVDEQPQQELYELLNEHLRRVEQLKPKQNVYPYIAQGVFHLLANAGIVPQVYNCCRTQKPIAPNLENSQWLIGFSFENGGIVNLAPPSENEPQTLIPVVDRKINGMELAIMQQLNSHNLPPIPAVTATGFSVDRAWINIEKILRDYTKYHLNKTIRSANLVDSLYLVDF